MPSLIAEYNPWHFGNFKSGRTQIPQSGLRERLLVFFFFFPLTYITSSRLGDFPGGPVVKTPRFLVEELRFYTTCAKLFQSCPTLCDPLDCSPPCSSVPGILQAKIQDWVAILFIRGSSQPRAQTHVSFVSCIGRRVLYH